MTKILLTLGIIAIMLSTNQLIGQTQPTQDVFNIGNETITIDGDGSDVAWALVPAIDINEIYRQEQPSLNSAIWKATWNDDGIYFLIEVDDNVWLPNWMSGLADWQSDKIELYIDCTNPQKDGGGASQGNGNWQVAPNFSQVNQGVETEFNGSFYADTYNGNGKYTIEYYVPFTVLLDNNGQTIDPYVTTTIGFDVTVIDLDDVNVGRNRMVWANTGNIDESWNSMDDVGLITFVGASTELNARFSASSTMVGPGAIIDFVDHSTGEPTSWQWDFGDGNTSGEQNPSHIYADLGTYDVSLTVTANGETKTTTKQNYISVTTENLPPDAEFEVSLSNGQTNETIQFSDKSMFEPESWRWYFGDGSTSSEQNPSHFYTKPGVYTVTLNVTNENGSNAETKTDYITIVAGNAPNVDFIADQTTIDEDQEIKFTDLSDLNPIAWEWDFGDGEDSEEQNPIHVYVNPGTYTVTLTATNSNGTATVVKENYITVNNVDYNSITNDKQWLEIFPNPTNSIVNVHTSYNNYKLSIIDLKGITVYDRVSNNSKATINLDALEHGIYLMKIISGNSFQTKKIIVN